MGPLASRVAAWAQVEETTGKACGNNATAAKDCILTTACGLDAVPSEVMKPVTNWTYFPPGVNSTFHATGLQQDKPYTFNIAVRNNYTGNIAVYTGTRGTPTYQRGVCPACWTDRVPVLAALPVGLTMFPCWLPCLLD